uniref:Uncharacterized protein n=1 Tax=Arundo donax TaxID=35708 RepID=A0A0A9EQP1_ARUDO
MSPQELQVESIRSWLGKTMRDDPGGEEREEQRR